MKRLLPIIIAVVLAVIAAGIVFFYTRGAEQRVIDEQQPVSVLVSVGNIPQGMALTDAVSGGLAEATVVPSAMAPVGSISAVTPDNATLLALSDVPPGQILLSANFVVSLPETTPITVPDGQIAVSLTIGDPQRVGNFVRPGSEVVVFNTYTPTSGAGAELTTRVLFPRVLVLAVGDTTETPQANPDGTTAAATPSALLTLAVDQSEAEKLILSLSTGSLYMGLLSDTTEIAKTNGTTSGNLFE